MANRRLHDRGLCIGLTLLLLLALPGFAGAATIEVTASTDLVNPGDTVDITVSILGLGDGVPPSLGTYDLSLVFEPSIFQLLPTSTTVSTFLGDEAMGEAIVSVSEGAMDIEVVVLSLLTPAQLTGLQGSEFELFTATFEGVGFGDALFDVVANGPLGDKDGTVIPLDGVTPVLVSGGTILDIPTASTLGLIGLGLLLAAAGVLVMRRMS